MNMVFDAIYDDGFAICLVDQVTNNAEKPGSPVFVDDRVSILYCKHSLEIDLGVCVSHDAFFISIEPTALVLYHVFCNGLKPVVMSMKSRLRLYSIHKLLLSCRVEP